MKLKDIFGLTGYVWYGYGGHQTPLTKPFSIQGTDLLNASGKWISTVRAAPKFKLHRMFVDNWMVVPETQPPFTLRINPTEQNFYYDDFFRLQKANGIKNILSLSGCFDWYKPALNGQSQRKHACYNPTMSPSDPKAWADFARLCKLFAEHYKDTGLIDYLQLLNEWDFPFDIDNPLMPEEYAVGAWEAIKAIRSVAPNQKIMIGCTLTPELETFIRLVGKLDELAASEGQPKERNVTLTFNLYNRSNSTNQGAGIAATYEETDTYGKFLKPFNDWCEHEGFYWAQTEGGYSSSPATSGDALKNKAPNLEGFTTEQAQGVLAIRIALICASLSRCVGVTFYHDKDGFEKEPFLHHGFNYDKDFGGKEDWSAKPARTICEEFLDRYGEWDVGDFMQHPYSYSVIVSNTEGDDEILFWTDKKNINGLTPFPSLTTPIPPPMLTLTIVNKQLQWSDGQPCHLYHADSPESRLHPSYGAQFSAECKALPTYGINTITVTMRGDDVTAISPWMNNNPAQGVDVVKLQMWYGQLKEFLIECEKNNLRGVIIAYLGERTNFKSISDQQYENWFVEMGKIFQDISGQIIFGWEEIWDGSDTNTMRFCDRIGSLLKSYLPNSLLMYHNNPGQKAFNAGSSFVKLVCIQETSISAMKATAQAALSKGFAVHFHEPYGLVKLSNTQDANKKIVTDLCAAAKEVGVKNVGIFASDYDLQAPDPNKLSYLYKHLSATLNGTTTNPTAMLKVSTSPSPFPGNIPLDNAQFPSGTKLYIYWDGEGKTPLKFMPSGQSESGKPYEYKGGAAVTFPDGTHTVTITDASGAKLGEASFMVGNTPPPPTDIKGLSYVLKPDGKIEFTFENGAKKLVQPI